MSYNASNYNEQGGARTVVGGSLDVATGGEIDIESGGALKIAGTAIAATAAEINNVADVRARVQTLTASGAVTPGVQLLLLNHATEIVAATIATTIAHPGFFVVKNISATGTAAHTVTITTGTWNGTNKVIALNLLNEAIIIYFDAAGNGTIVENVGAVALSG